MRLRAFISALGGAAVWPLVGRAQSSMPVVGFLNSLSSAETSHVVSAFREGVVQAGLVEGKSLRFEYLYADGVYQRLPGMAAEFVRQMLLSLRPEHRPQRWPQRRRRRPFRSSSSLVLIPSWRDSLRATTDPAAMPLAYA
jgi:hypothetical protein